MAGTVLDTYLVYQFLKRLVTPFTSWDAYKLGLIDEMGGRTQVKIDTDVQKNAWGRFDILVANIKKILNHIPGMSTRIGSLAAAMYLVKEGADETDPAVIEERLTHYVKLVEDGGVAVNNAGGGQVAGIGVGPSGEPGMYQKKSKYKSGNEAEEKKLTANLKKVMTQLK